MNEGEAYHVQTHERSNHVGKVKVTVLLAAFQLFKEKAEHHGSTNATDALKKCQWHRNHHQVPLVRADKGSNETWHDVLLRRGCLSVNFHTFIILYSQAIRQVLRAIVLAQQHKVLKLQGALETTRDHRRNHGKRPLHEAASIIPFTIFISAIIPFLRRNLLHTFLSTERKSSTIF